MNSIDIKQLSGSIWDMSLFYPYLTRCTIKGAAAVQNATVDQKQPAKTLWNAPSHNGRTEIRT